MYARDNMTPRHQSAHHMYQYKHRIQPVEECRRDLKLMMLTATWLHGECIARTVGWWEVLTFTPSASRPGATHPVVELAKAVMPLKPEPESVLLDLGPDIAAEPKRWPLPHRFVISKQFAPKVAGRHVLVVDDTWVSGDKPQSVALALKAAGARAVTIVCIARWLNWTYNEQHQRLISRLKAPYDARQCPVTGSACSGAGAVPLRH
jgi:phosphoribosylpyrophosphate synthetase